MFLVNILEKSGRKLNKTWIDKEGEIYNRLMKLWIGLNDTEIYLMKANQSSQNSSLKHYG